MSTWAPVMLPGVTCNALRMVQSSTGEGKGQGGPRDVSSILSVRWKFLSRSGLIQCVKAWLWGLCSELGFVFCDHRTFFEEWRLLSWYGMCLWKCGKTVLTGRFASLVRWALYEVCQGGSPSPGEKWEHKWQASCVWERAWQEVLALPTVKAAQVGTHLNCLYTNVHNMKNKQADGLCKAAELRPHRDCGDMMG